jgi:hypothetical protein
MEDTVVGRAPDADPTVSPAESHNIKGADAGPHTVQGLAAALQEARAENESLKVALVSRTVIGQATGILMRENHLTADAAFKELVRRSSHSNVKVRDIAQGVVATANSRAEELLARLGLLP